MLYMNKRLMILGILLLGILVASWMVMPVILGGSSQINLASAPALTGQLSQAFATSGTSSTLPVEGRDYRLENTNYFDTDIWVVTSIKALNNTMNDGWVVLKKQSGIYQIVLGPGTAFPSSYVQNMPIDVSRYLNQKGVVYVSSGQ